jgi:predicted aspartyl protease
MTNYSFPPNICVSAFDAVGRVCRLACVFLLWAFPLHQACGAETKPSPMEAFMTQRGYRPIHVERDVANHFLIRGKLNGGRSVFGLDTGAPCTFVDTTKATRLKRLANQDSVRGLFGFEAKDIPVVAIDCIDLNGTVISNQLMRVLNLHIDRQVRTGSYIPSSGPFRDNDVLLGLDFLTDTHAFLDCCGMPTLYVRGSAPPQQLAETMDASFKQSGFICVPLRASHGKLFVTASVNDKEADFILDTGAGATDLDSHQLENFHMDPREVLGRSSDIGGHRTELRYATIRSLRMGAYEHKNFHVGTDDLGLLKRKTEKDRPPLLGLLGPDLLGKAQGLIDCSGAKLYLKPSPAN